MSSCYSFFILSLDNQDGKYKIGDLLAAALRDRLPMRSQLTTVKEAQDNLLQRECYNETECKKLESVSFVELMLTTTQFAPILRQLSHSDKLLLLNFLVAELLRESGIVPMSIQDDVHRQGLHDSFEAAAILAQALKETEELIHG